MRLIPVLDLKGGAVVRGVGGRRDEYRPIESVLVGSSDPIEVAEALRERFGFREFYLADLDAIAGHPPRLDLACELASHDLRLLVDAGLRDAVAGRALLDAGVSRVIAALETSPGPAHLRALVGDLGAGRVTFSLDMQSGALLTAGGGWPTANFAAAVDTAKCALDCGVHSLILLDLAGVGEGGGVPTLGLCRAVRELAPDVEIITGGGVRDASDLEALDEAGADGVLVASALHNGSLTPDDCARWRE